jgi:hypothetical protein
LPVRAVRFLQSGSIWPIAVHADGLLGAAAASDEC